MSRRSVEPQGSFIAEHERRRPLTRCVLALVHVLVLIGLLIAGAGPMLWLIAASLNSTQDVLREPLGVLANIGEWGNYASALAGVDAGRYLMNTVIAAVGSTIATLLVAVTAGYVIAILKPWWGGILSAGILATILLPAVVSLVPLYLSVVDLFGTGVSLQNTFWAVWLPAGANAFSVLLVTSFFRSLPSELIEAASLDGAGPLRTLWSIVLPLSRPILGVVALLAAIGSWKDYLWPSLVLSDPKLRPISVALPAIEKTTELSTFFAALVLASIVPIVLFLIFQRPLLASVSMSAGMKD